MPGLPSLHSTLPSRRRALGLAAVGAFTAVATAVTSARSASAADATTMAVTPRSSTAAVNAWLAAGGVRVLRGTIVLTAPLVIPAGTHLDATSASITGPASDNVLRNQAAVPTATTTAAVKAGSAVVVTKAAVFSAASVGRAVQVLGVRTGDDLVAFTTVDGQSYNGSRLGDCEGDITDVTVEDVYGQSCLCLLKVTSGTGAAGAQRHIRRFTASGLAGSVTGRSPVQIVDYAGPTWFEGTISDVTALGNGGPSVNVAVGTLGNLVVQDVTWPASAPAPTGGIVRVSATSASSVTVRRLTNRSIRTGNGIGVALAVASVGTASIGNVSCPVLAPKFDSVRLVRAAAKIGTLAISDDSSAARDGNVFAIDAAAKGYRITKASFARVSRASGSLWVADADATTSTAISVVGVQGGRALALLRAPAQITVQDTKQPGASGAGVRLNSAAASPVRVVVDSTTRPGALLSRTASQRVSAVSPFVTVDAALLTPSNADVVLNSGKKYTAGQIKWDAAAKRWRTTTVKAPAPTPKPTPSTPTPTTPTATPAPSTTPAPSMTPSATPSPEPSSTPSLSPSPSLEPAAG